MITRAAQPVGGRSCDGCTLCCKLLSIEELAKPADVMCGDCEAGSGCRIYPDRPTECRGFFCEYLLDPALGEEWQPSHSNMVVSFEDYSNSIVIHVDDSDPPDWDEIPGAHGSTLELQAVRNLYTAFRDLDTRVLGLSTQAPAWQREFADRYALPFDLVSDAQLALARALALPTFATGGETYLGRLTLCIIDGRIDNVFYPVHPPDVHPRDMLAWLTDAVGYGLESRINS